MLSSVSEPGLLLAANACCRAARCQQASSWPALHCLRTIVTIAPWLGVIDTAIGIENAFGGGSGSMWSILAAINYRLSLALYPTALGLAVAVMAFLMHAHLRTLLDAEVVEMRAATLELLNRLARLG